MKTEISGKTIELARGDITLQAVDAIVNAANSRLAGGGGVDGAVHRRGGETIMADTNARYPQGCPTGSAVISVAGDLPAKFVIHAVGPVWNGGSRGEEILLAGAFRCSLELAWRHGCHSLAMPALSTGAYRFPIDRAAQIALETTAQFFEDHPLPELVRFVLFDEVAYEAFASALAGRMPRDTNK